MIIASLGRERSAEHAQASCEYIFKAQNVKKNVASLAAVSQGHITFVFEVYRREVKIFEFTKKSRVSFTTLLHSSTDRSSYQFCDGIFIHQQT